MNIWNDILLKNKKGHQFKNAKSISGSDYNKKFQIFEVLVTETLVVIDPSTRWHSLPVQGDDGIDFLGEIEQVETPYLIGKPDEIILGQIKRRKTSYGRDDFHCDIIKIIEYYNHNYSQKATLLEIIHVLSTDKQVNARKWLDNITFPYMSYQVLPLNAVDFLKFWKMNPRFVKHELTDVCTQEELAAFMDYLNGFQEDWSSLVKIGFSSPKTAYTDDEICVKFTIKSSVDLPLNLYLEWVPSAYNNAIVMIYPENSIKNSISPYCITVFREQDIILRLKAVHAGTLDLGTVNIYSSSQEQIYSCCLGIIDIYEGIGNKFFALSFSSQITRIRSDMANCHMPGFHAFALLGQGGIGKSRFAREIMIHAQNKEYYAFSLQNANDFNNSRDIILDMFIKLIDTYTAGIVSYENIHERLRQKLGVRFDSEWNKSFQNYIINNVLSDSDLENLAKCLLVLVIMQTHQQPVFVWLSDMHWASKETLMILKKFLALLRLNKGYLANQIMFLFEGRDSDALLVEEKVFFPYIWLEFCENDFIEKITLPVWQHEYCSDYIKMLINPQNHPLNDNLRALIKLTENNAEGNPMHIREFLRYLRDMEYITVNKDGTLTLIDKTPCFTNEAHDLLEIIRKRISFYHDKFADIIDCYIILAVLNANQQVMYEYLTKQLSKTYYNYPILEKTIGIVSETDADKLFLHENYKNLLKVYPIHNEIMLGKALQHYQNIANGTDIEKLDIVAMHMMFTDMNYPCISEKLSEIIQDNSSDYLVFSAYNLMQHVPSKYRKEISLHEIYYEMSEIAIRIGSWQDSIKHLEKITKKRYSTESECLYYMMACKSLGNMYGNSVELKKSFESCENGLKEVDRLLKNDSFSTSQIKSEFQRQKELLLNRIAVTCWISGCPDASVPYQEEALCLSKARGDIYSEAHTLYETGMRQLHSDISLGVSNIRKALSFLPLKGKYTEPQERYLVRVELLIGELLQYTHKLTEGRSLDEIEAESREICSELSVGSANYESALCHTVNAICNVLKGDYDTALARFLTSLDCSNLGRFETLRWRAYLNVSQVFLLLSKQNQNNSYREQAQKYAERGSKILNATRENNTDHPSYLNHMEMPYHHFRYILGDEQLFFQKDFEECTLCVPWHEYCFYII